MRSILKWFLFMVILSTTLLATDAVASPADLLAAGRVDEVIASLQSQVKASPENAGAYNYLCRAYYALGDWDRAIANCEKSVKLASDNSDYHLWLGRAYGEKADHVNPFSAASLAGKLRREFERAVELSPNSVEARSDLAEFYIDAPGIVGGGLDKARLQAQALAGFAPAKAHYLNGRIAEKEKDAAVAEKEYRAAIDASQGHANDWLNLALFYRHGNKLDDMEQALMRAANAPKGQNEVLVEVSQILQRSGRNLPGATQLARRYIASNGLSEKSPLFKAHYVLGTALEKQGDKEGAAQEYRAALALAGNFSAAQQALKNVSKQ
jgi:tetratricopeptide (TPR) repeat protein